MAMTKKDFQEIADAVDQAKRRVRDIATESDERETYEHALEIVTRELATACARQYKGGYGFNRSRFVEAAGFPDA